MVLRVTTDDYLSAFSDELIGRSFFFCATSAIPRFVRGRWADNATPEGRDIWEARATEAYRFTFAIAGDAYILYRIGPHDIKRRLR